MTLPLAGRRVLVTRAAHQAGKLSNGLRALGAEPVEVPVLEIGPPASFEPLDAALRDLSRFEWVIFTSANTVRALAARWQEVGLHAVRSPQLKVAAIGNTTAAAARENGWKVTIVPETYVAESLVATLGNELAASRVLLARASAARDVIPDALRATGAQVSVVDAYQNLIPADAPERLRQALKAGLDAATFTSSSTVTHLADVAKAAELPFPFSGVPACSIGRITSQTLREYGWPPAAEALSSDIHGLIAAVQLVFDRQR